MTRKIEVTRTAKLSGLLIAAAYCVTVMAAPVAEATPGVRAACPTCSSAQRCSVDGILNRALGAATLSATPECHLLVTGIGASGLDGFAQDSLPVNAQRVRTFFTGPNLGHSEPGARQVVTFRANVPGGVLATTTVEDLGNNTIEIRPDFSPVGATRYTVTVMNGGVVDRVVTDLTSAAIQTGDCVEVEVS